jgi:hypothetical protein
LTKLKAYGKKLMERTIFTFWTFKNILTMDI